MTPRQFKTGLAPRAPRRLGQPGLRRPATSPHYIRPSRIAGVFASLRDSSRPAAGPADRAGLRFSAGPTLAPTAAKACRLGPWDGRRAKTMDTVKGGLDWRRGSPGRGGCRRSGEVAATRCAPRSPQRSDPVSGAGFAGSSVSLSGPLRRNCADDLRSRSGSAAAPLFVFYGLLAAPAFAVEGCCKRRNSFLPSPSAGALSSAARRQCT